MDASHLRHAYAVLQLSPPVTEERLKHRYKALVRRWHPDRYQADPVGQAEATERLRDINLAYDLVTASLAPSEPEAVVPPATANDQPFSWSPERVDAIVESINRTNRISLVPEMSVHRWLSIAAVVAYLVVSSILLPSLEGHGSRDIARAVGRATAFFWLPMYLIWTADRDDRGSLESSCVSDRRMVVHGSARSCSNSDLDSRLNCAVNGRGPYRQWCARVLGSFLGAKTPVCSAGGRSSSVHCSMRPRRLLSCWPAAILREASGLKC